MNDAYALHVTAAKTLADECRQREFRLFIYLRIRFSMGEKQGIYRDRHARSLNAYARTKLEGENEILKIDKGLVLRTNIFGLTRHGLSFSEWVLMD